MNRKPFFEKFDRFADALDAVAKMRELVLEPSIQVPDGWEKTSLADLVSVLNGRAYSKDELLAAGTPVLRVGNLFTSKHWYYSDLELEPDKYCDKGDLIFAWSASFGPLVRPGPKVIYSHSRSATSGL